MGYDCMHVTELDIPPELEDKAAVLIEEYIDGMDDSVKDYYLPGLVHIEGGLIELGMYDRDSENSSIEITDDDVTPFLGDEFPDNIIGWLHNDCVDTLLTPVIDYLRDNGVPVTGWIFTDYEQMEISFMFWLDGKLVDHYANECGAARFIMEDIKKKGKMDLKIRDRVRD